MGNKEWGTGNDLRITLKHYSLERTDHDLEIFLLLYRTWTNG